jgi:hypothetical protein
VAFAIEREGKLGTALIASELVEFCQLHGLDIPGVKEADDGRAKLQVGALMRRVFQDVDEINVDGYTVSRGRREYRKPSGDMDFTPEYKFTK